MRSAFRNEYNSKKEVDKKCKEVHREESSLFHTADSISLDDDALMGPSSNMVDEDALVV